MNNTALVCVGCGAPPGVRSVLFVPKDGAPPAMVCGQCSARADTDLAHRRRLELRLMSGVPFPKSERPTTTEDATGMPPWSSAAVSALVNSPNFCKTLKDRAHCGDRQLLMVATPDGGNEFSILLRYLR